MDCKNCIWFWEEFDNDFPSCHRHICEEEEGAIKKEREKQNRIKEEESEDNNE